MARSPEQERTVVEPSLSSDQIMSQQEQATPTSSLPSMLLHLPQRYFVALVKPSAATYTLDKGKASWRLVWIQLLAWAVLDAALGVLVNIISPPTITSSFSRLFAFTTSYGLVIVVPALFFLVMGFAYGIARVFGGRGTFLEQCNTSLYIDAPLGILSKLLALIPVVGRILNTVLSLYGIVLQVFALIVVHRADKTAE